MPSSVTLKMMPLVVFMAVSTVALAAGDANGGGSKSPVESGGMANAIGTVLTFGLLVIVLTKVAWKPLLKSLQTREDFIRDSLATAKRDREDAEAKLKDYEQRLAASRQEATAIVEEGRRDAEVLRRKILDDTRSEAEDMMARAKREISIARDTAVKEIYTVTGNLAADIAGCMIEKEIDSSVHERLIQDSIEQISGMEKRN